MFALFVYVFSCCDKRHPTKTATNKTEKRAYWVQGRSAKVKINLHLINRYACHNYVAFSFYTDMAMWNLYGERETEKKSWKSYLVSNCKWQALKGNSKAWIWKINANDACHLSTRRKNKVNKMYKIETFTSTFDRWLEWLKAWVARARFMFCNRNELFSFDLLTSVCFCLLSALPYTAISKFSRVRRLFQTNLFS